MHEYLESMLHVPRINDNYTREKEALLGLKPCFDGIQRKETDVNGKSRHGPAKETHEGRRRIRHFFHVKNTTHICETFGLDQETFLHRL